MLYNVTLVSAEHLCESALCVCVNIPSLLSPKMATIKDFSVFLDMRKYKKSTHKISIKNGHNKGQKWYDLTEAEDIKKRWQEYTELYKKDLHDPDDHDGVITHLEPDMLECEVKWALESITTISVELFQI